MGSGFRVWGFWGFFRLTLSLKTLHNCSPPASHLGSVSFGFLAVIFLGYEEFDLPKPGSRGEVSRDPFQGIHREPKP